MENTNENNENNDFVTRVFDELESLQVKIEEAQSDREALLQSLAVKLDKKTFCHDGQWYQVTTRRKKSKKNPDEPYQKTMLKRLPGPPRSWLGFVNLSDATPVEPEEDGASEAPSTENDEGAVVL